VLIPNHIHLLIRTGEEPLSTLMRKLLTGYAIYFNKKYKRHGYLYQNRYKSILCQEDMYFLELVRYIHLNPIRSGIVKGIGGLNRYRWSGHSGLIKVHKRAWQESDEVLLWFGKRRRPAVEKYMKFITDGLKMGKRPELTGGGLRRSAGGNWEAVQDLKRARDCWRGDERILGDGIFVDEVLEASEERLLRQEKLKRDGWNIDKIAERVCDHFDIDKNDLKKRGRQNAVSNAKAVMCYLASRELGLTGAEIGRYIGVSRVAVVKAVARGEALGVGKCLKLLS
jgi:hypothetical protein